MLTAGILGAVLAAGFATPKALGGPAGPRTGRHPWAHEVGGRRRLTAGTLEYEIERARRHERPLSVLAIVPDELDAPGRRGRRLAAEAARPVDAAIEAAVRAIDIVERIGPSRFRVALPETGPEGGRIVAERIRLRIDATRPELEPGRVVGVSVSIGISTYPADGTDTVELEAAAERALARAQELGGNRTVLFSVPAGAPRGWGLRSTSAAGTTASAATTVTAAVTIWIPISWAGRSWSTAKATSCAAWITTSTIANRVRASERKW